jgi:heme-degrading monooxygenase HmoA
MFARVTTAYIRKDLIEKATKIAEESIVPAAKKQAGFRSMDVLLDREAGKVIFITYWESMQNIEANEESLYYQQQLMKLMVAFTADPMRERFEVVVQA